MRAVDGHRDDRHAGFQGQSNEALVTVKFDAVALRPGAEDFVVTSREDHDRIATTQRLEPVLRTGRKHPRFSQ
jgi:hypothetical protein